GGQASPARQMAVDIEQADRAYQRHRHQRERQRSLPAHARDHDVAEMTTRLRIVEAIVVVDEIRREWRLVQRPQQRNRIALQAVDDERTAGLKALDDRGIARVAKLLAGAPQRAAAHRAVDVSGGIVTVADRNAAVVIAVTRREADRIFARNGKPELATWRVVGTLRPETQHAIFAGRGKRLVVVSAGRLASLGEEHVAIIVEENLGDFRIRRR